MRATLSHNAQWGYPPARRRATRKYRSWSGQLLASKKRTRRVLLTITAHLVNPDRDEAPARAQAILGAYGAASYLDARDAARAARQFREWISSSLQPTHLFAEYPVTHRLDDGRVVRGWLDVLVETADGCIVIDHKSSPRPRSEWAGEIVEYSGQLARYRRALEASGKCVLGVWVHLPVAGAVVLTTV